MFECSGGEVGPGFCCDVVGFQAITILFRPDMFFGLCWAFLFILKMFVDPKPGRKNETLRPSFVPICFVRVHCRENL